MSGARQAVIAGAALGVLVGLGGAGAALRAVLPRVSGRLRLPGLRADVEVLRDHWGVPHLLAQSSADLLLAQGYVHAQDRLWQMEYQRRLAGGRLAELLGPAALASDRAARVLGFARLARREAALLDGAGRAALDAYVAGVNARIAQLGARLPVEFVLLRARPQPWSAEDVLATCKLLALRQLDVWAGALLHAAMRDAPADDRPEAALRRREVALAEALAALPSVGCAGGSAWAVSGAHTASGRPLLASDPHAALRLPCLWYENYLAGGDLHVTGASVPGLPGVLVGHNEQIAWGMADAADGAPELRATRLDPRDPQRYQLDSGWEQAEVFHETIGVRGEPAPHVETVYVTHHGPLVSALTPAAAGEGLALHWAALAPGRQVEAVLALNRACDWPSFRAALGGWAAPAQHVLYADTDGHIGALLAGAPEAPPVFDPPGGVLVAADSQLSEHAPPHPADAPQGSYRAARIHRLLGLSRRHTRHSFARLQNDRLSLPGLELAALAGRLPAHNDLQRAARAELAAWDGQLHPDSAGAAIYVRLRGHLLALAGANQPGAQLWAAEHHQARWLPHLLRRLAEDDGRRWGDLLEQAWQRAVTALQREGGPSARGWRYGEGRRLRLRHPLDWAPALTRLLGRGPFAAAGGADSLGGCYRIGADTWAGPALRQICDLDEWDNSESIGAGGQSGHPASRHYADLARPWLDGRYRPLLWTRDAIDEGATVRLTLTADE